MTTGPALLTANDLALAYEKRGRYDDSIREMLRARNIRVSRIARGVPLGGELEYVDAGTLSQALMERKEI